MEISYITYNTESGSINISEDVVTGLIISSVKEIAGVSGLANSAGTEFAELLGLKTVSKGIKVQLVDSKVITDIIIMVKYGYNIMDVAKAVQESVREAIISATGIEDSEINIHISGIAFDK